jgi:hypothetical protein
MQEVNIDDLLGDHCGQNTKCSWKSWKEHVFKPLGLTLEEGAGIYTDDSIVTGQQALSVVKNSKWTFIDPVESWRKEYQILFKTRIESGTVLTTCDGEPAKLTIELSQGNQPFIFGKAYIPDTVGHKIGRFLQSIHDPVRFGMKVILLPKSRNEVLAKFGLQENEVGVKSLKIIRYSTSGESLLGEVYQWAD